ncbi:hypothetical protein BDV95DRAFT_121996 [Massariosphaeria phaeospora]|uniref:BHLH domain-containing protein n=1 Tax=Massariosphaeria phaeospora TaxID=100035 RepID=A0A7C8IB54_9PLEO|nr:hypothetical protein BDV95DRAFT_121996 [Massariosphaeria phaeospora]
MASQSPSKNGNDRPRLTEAEKKNNHIRSEKKRREAIRAGYDRLASIVPGMAGQGRSEALVLEATLKYMREQIVEREELMEEARAKGFDTSKMELPRATVEACKAQLARIEGERRLGEV